MARAVLVDLNDLSPEARARIGGGGIDVQDSARNSARRQSGRLLEQQLLTTHSWYRRRGLALIRQHHPEVIGAPAAVAHDGRMIRPGTLRFKNGGAPCDFGGHAARVGAILFDAKVVTARATYEHDPDQYHQLEELVAHQALHRMSSPARAFLFLADQELGIAYIVQDLRLPLAREPLPCRRGRGVDTEHLWPIVRRPADLALAQGTPAWDWLSLFLRDLDEADAARPASALLHSHLERR